MHKYLPCVHAQYTSWLRVPWFLYASEASQLQNFQLLDVSPNRISPWFFFSPSLFYYSLSLPFKSAYPWYWIVHVYIDTERERERVIRSEFNFNT